MFLKRRATALRVGERAFRGHHGKKCYSSGLEASMYSFTCFWWRRLGCKLTWGADGTACWERAGMRHWRCGTGNLRWCWCGFLFPSARPSPEFASSCLLSRYPLSAPLYLHLRNGTSLPAASWIWLQSSEMTSPALLFTISSLCKYPWNTPILVVWMHRLISLRLWTIQGPFLFSLFTASWGLSCCSSRVCCFFPWCWFSSEGGWLFLLPGYRLWQILLHSLHVDSVLGFSFLNYLWLFERVPSFRDSLQLLANESLPSCFPA